MKKPSEIIKIIEEFKKNLEFIPTGFKKLDELLDGGFLKKELIVIGASTGIGKSMFGAQILYQVARKGFKTAYYSLEISNEMIVSRLIGQLSNIKPTRIMAGLLDVDEYDAKSKAKAKITAYDEFMSFTDELYTLEEIEKDIRANEYEFIVIDFIQNMQAKGTMDEYSRLSMLSISLQKLAKEMNCCILILSQLSNRVARDGSKVIEFKGSGNIAIVADLGFILRRADEPINGKQLVELHLMKNRRGLSGEKKNFEYTHPGGMLSEVNINVNEVKY